MSHLDVGVNLFLKASYLSQVLPDGLLEMQDTAALLLWVTRNFQLEAHSLLFLTVLLGRNIMNNTDKQRRKSDKGHKAGGPVLPCAWAPRVTTGY